MQLFFLSIKLSEQNSYLFLAEICRLKRSARAKSMSEKIHVNTFEM